MNIQIRSWNHMGTSTCNHGSAACNLVCLHWSTDGQRLSNQRWSTTPIVWIHLKLSQLSSVYWNKIGLIYTGRFYVQSQRMVWYIKTWKMLNHYKCVDIDLSSWCSMTIMELTYICHLDVRSPLRSWHTSANFIFNDHKRVEIHVPAWCSANTRGPTNTLCQKYLYM